MNPTMAPDALSRSSRARTVARVTPEVHRQVRQAAAAVMAQEGQQPLVQGVHESFWVVQLSRSVKCLGNLYKALPSVDTARPPTKPGLPVRPPCSAPS